MQMGKCSIETISKILLVTINVIFIAIGFVIAAFGIVVATGSNIFGGYIEPLFRDAGGNESVGSFFLYVAISGAVLGSFILVIASVGACGACCNKKCLLYSYVAAMGVILVIEIALVVVCVLKWDWVESQLKSALKLSINDQYAGSTATDSISVAWNYAFVTFHCCGVFNSTDLSSAKKWNSTNKIPSTCCIVTGSFPDQSDPTDPSCPTQPTTGNSHAHKGCYEHILDLILQYNDYILGISVAIATLQIFTLVAAIVIARTRNKIRPT
ncbi:tetraspanin-1-like [Mytilus californianus]|uniref:tetraspanin-1-like n=1 Tax=Mytilus californianus TaxID=6549 RepID=UPI00224641C3|nr:tetraspanin-1-like [Mytilus californianus]